MTFIVISLFVGLSKREVIHGRSQVLRHIQSFPNISTVLHCSVRIGSDPSQKAETVSIVQASHVCHTLSLFPFSISQFLSFSFLFHISVLGPALQVTQCCSHTLISFPMIIPRTEDVPKLIHHTGTDSNEWKMPKMIHYHCNWKIIISQFSLSKQ